MRIVIIVDFLRPNGAGLMALLQADLLSSAGHEVTFVCGAASDPIAAAVRRRGVNVKAFSSSEVPFDHPLNRDASVQLRSATWSFVQTQLGQERPDVVCIHNCGRVLDQHRIVELSHVLPVVYTMHDEWFLGDAHYRFLDQPEVVSTFEPHRAGQAINHDFSHLAPVEQCSGNLTVLAPSRWLHKRCLFRYPRIRAVHLTNPVDPSLFSAMERGEARAMLGVKEDAKIVLAVGNPSQSRKGLRRLAESLATLTHELPVLIGVGGNSSFVGHAARDVVRPGMLSNILERSAGPAPKLAGFRPNSIVVGQASREMMRLFYGCADLVVHPSIIDNLPTVPIEAGFVGTRCIASDVGGTAETVAEIDGLFPSHISAVDLGKRVRSELDLVAQETPAQRSARRGRQTERFCPKTHLSLLESLLQGVCNT